MADPDEASLSDLERRALAALDELDDEDGTRLLRVVAAMRVGVEIDPADLFGKSPEELRQFADRLWQQIAAQGSEH